SWPTATPSAPCSARTAASSTSASRRRRGRTAAAPWAQVDPLARPAPEETAEHVAEVRAVVVGGGRPAGVLPVRDVVHDDRREHRQQLAEIDPAAGGRGGAEPRGHRGLRGGAIHAELRRDV